MPVEGPTSPVQKYKIVYISFPGPLSLLTQFYDHKLRHLDFPDRTLCLRLFVNGFATPGPNQIPVNLNRPILKINTLPFQAGGLAKAIEVAVSIKSVFGRTL